MKSNEFTIRCYDGEIPPFVAVELDRLYESIFSSLSHFSVYGWDETGTSTYAVFQAGSIRALFLFVRQYEQVRVLNETITVDAQELTRFVEYIFTRYPAVKVVLFKAFEVNKLSLSFPYQRYNFSEDFVLKLPATTQGYFSSLGKNTRRNIKRYGNRLADCFSSSRFIILENEAVDERHIRRLVEFNHARMHGKRSGSRLDEDETLRLVKLAKAAGMAGLICIDEKVVAGALSFRVGSNYFLTLLAHDPAYDHYWIGILCCYWTVCGCIERGGKEFHFLWGRYEYKLALGAVLRGLDNITVYRSHMHLLINGRIAWQMASAACKRQALLWLKYGDSWLAWHLRGLMRHARTASHRMEARVIGEERQQGVSPKN